MTDAYIKNPTFANSSSENWNGSPTLDGIGGYINAQKKSTQDGETFDVWQEVSGLSKGIYSLEVQAFYQGSTAGQSQLYVKAGNNEVKVNIMSIHSDVHTGSEALYNSSHASGVGGTADAWSNDGNGYIPTCQQGASAYFNEGHYKANIAWIEVTEDNATLRIGIKSSGSTAGDWTCFDNFKLTHYAMSTTGTFYMRNRQSGKFLAQGGTWGTQAIVSESAGLDMIVMQNGDRYVFDTKVVNGYNHFLKANGYVDSQVDFLSWTQREGNYYTLSDYDNKETNFLVPGNEVGGNATAVFSGTNAYDHAAQWELVSRDQLVNELRNSGASYFNPKNATILIPGAGFNNFDERNKRWKGSPTIGGYVRQAGSNYCAEKFRDSDNSGIFDVYQEVYGIPDGVYKIQANAFYRDGVAKTEGSNVSNALLYASSGDNEVSVAVPSIYSQAGASGQPTTTSGNVPVPAFQTNSGNIPNSLSGAAEAFAAGLYQTNSITVTVTGGTLRLGVKSNGYVQYDWTCFDNFRLTYLGDGTISIPSTCYVRNVATGEFIRAGGYYEAQSIRDEWGLPLNFVDKGNGQYSIDTRISNGGEYQYMGIYGYMDNAEVLFTVKDLGNDKYAILTSDGKCLATSDGDNYVNFDRGVTESDTHAQWELLTRDQLIAELKNSNASDSNPQDATFLIEGSNLGRHDLRVTADNIWQGIELVGTKENPIEHGGVEQSDAHANFCVEKWNENFDTYQTISGLPAGVYELTVQGYYRSGSTTDAADKTTAGTDVLRPFLYVKQDGNLIGQAPLLSIFDEEVTASGTDGFSYRVNGVYVPNSLSDAGKVFRDGHYMPSGEYNKVRFVVPSDGATVQIGVKKNVLYASDWTAFDNFRLTYLGSTSEAQTVYTTEIGSILGTFYLKNAQTGTYLTAGGTDGVSAVLGDKMYEHSIYEDTNTDSKYEKGVRETDFTFVAVGADKFVIETGIGDGYLTLKGKLNGKNEVHVVKKVTGNNIGGNEYAVYDPTPKVEGEKTWIRFLKNGGYGTVTDENPATNGNIRWIFQTKEDLLAEFLNATESNPIDATFLLRGTAFHKDDSRNSAWTGTPEVGGAESNYVGSASGRTFDISQKLTGVPNGVYEYTLQGYYIDNSSDAPQTDVRYYVSTDSKTLFVNNYPAGTTTFINSKNYTATNPYTVWEETFVDGRFLADIENETTSKNDKTEVTLSGTVFTVGGMNFCNISTDNANNNQVNSNFAVAGNSSWLARNGGLYSQAGGTRQIAINNLSPGQTVKIKRNRGTENGDITVVNDVLKQDIAASTNDELVFRVVKNGIATLNVDRYVYIQTISVMTELVSNSVSISNQNDASTVFANGQGTHPVIRFKVENNTIIAGVYNTTKTDNASLYIDNLRLTYLGENATNVASSITIPKGIIHKPSRFYKLAEANGDLTLDKTTYKTTTNNTTLSDEAMVAHDVLTGTLIQHTPVYAETVYAMAEQKLEIVLPSSYTNKNQSANRYYQRIYNYKTDGLFVEDATNTGVFDFSNENVGDHTNEAIKNAMRIYEGVTEAPAGGWVLGTRWGQQMVSLFNYTTPTTFSAPIQIGIDHGDFTDVGDMGMFGNLTEPTLGQRIIYTIQPASVMVKKLENCTGDVFLEEKSISFPTIWYGEQEGMNPTDLNAVALDLTLKNYFTDAEKVPASADFTITLNDGGTGITLATTNFGGNGERFIKFNYPEVTTDGATYKREVINYKDKEAVITVTSGGKNIARFRLHFVPNTELRPWKDIMGQGHLRRSPVYLEQHAVEIDRMDFDGAGKAQTTYPSTWPVADEEYAINGAEEWRNVASYDQFNPYPMDFDQTSFAANYFNAIWGQYSVMKSVRIPSYKDIRPFKDVNQLYHDYFALEGTTSQQHKYPGGGYFMYIDASNFPSSIGTLKLQEDLCEGTTIHFSGWVSSMDLSKDSKGNNNGNAPGYLLFSIVGVKQDGTQEVIESFCPGPIRADAIEYNGGKVVATEYNKEVWGDASNSIWQQFAFSFVIKDAVYQSYALKIDNYCSNTSGGDMMVDDVRLYIQKAVPDIVQNSPVCSTGDVADMQIYTTFDQLLNAVNMNEAADETAAYGTYADKSAGGKIIPSGWYCFLDKEEYDKAIGAINHSASESEVTKAYDAAFNAALVTNGGVGGYYQFDFSTHFESNNGGATSYTHETTVNNVTTTQHVTYTARAESITNEGGTERRIYLNPKDCVVSLKDLTYYSDGTDDTPISAVWNMNVGVATVYGNESGKTERYVDLSAFDELRVYQSKADEEAYGAVRCLFYPEELATDNTKNFKVSKGANDGNKPDIEFERSEDGAYWRIDLNKVKEETGQVKLICIKASAYNTQATVTAIHAVRKPAVLESQKDYYIVFRAYKGETGETSVGGPTSFFNLKSTECAAMSAFSLVSGVELRYDGTLEASGNAYCEGQIATVKMEMQAINTAAGTPVKEEDLFYDWWLGDVTSFSSVANGKHDSPQNVLFSFREAYPEATLFEGQPEKVEALDGGGYKYNFTEADRTYLKELVDEGKFLLYQSSLNVKIANSSGYQAVSLMPITALLENLTGLPYCKGPIEIKIPVAGKAPSAKNGFVGTTYPMDEVPLRIGLAQIQSVKDETADSWLEANNALYIPLRDITFSGEDGYTKGFGKKKHNWGTGSSNTLDIAAVYLAETDDPNMVSYGEDIDEAGNRELRYVGKVHVFQAALNKSKFEDYVKLTFNPDFANNVKEGYRYVLKTSFEETNESGTANPCHGDLLIPLYIVPEYQVWAGGADGNWANDDNWRRADNEELKFATTTDRLTNESNTTVKGFVPMDFTNVLMQSNSVAVLNSVTKENDLVKFNETDGHTPDIQYHLAAKVKKPPFSWFPQDRTSDIYCEPFYNNTAKDIHFEPHSQMLNTQYLTYEQAWVEYALESGRWYTLSSPLQGVVSGDMYLPRGTAKQETPYFDPITYNNADYTRLAPAVYQQAWDKAEATTYRLERDELVNMRPPALESSTATVNVARAFDWSREYNDVKVPFGVNGFSVKVDMSRIEDYTKVEGEHDVLLRLPKKDDTYNYYMYDDNTNGSQTVDLTTSVNGKNLRENAGKLFTDGMLAAGMTVALTNNSAGNPYFLVGNPFMSGLDLDKFFAVNTGLEKKYWLLTKDSYSTGVKDEKQNWMSTDNAATGDVAPLQAFFVKRSDGAGGSLDVTFTPEMAVQLTGEALLTRAGGGAATLRLTAMCDGVESHAVVVCREDACEEFVEGEDAEALFDSHLSHVPTIYTPAGEVAAAINVRRSLHGLPIGIGGTGDLATLMVGGVEEFGHALYLYDSVTGESVPVSSSDFSLSVEGNTFGRYFLVTSPIDGSAADPAPLIRVEGRVVSVSSLSHELISVEVYDVVGRRIRVEKNAGHRTLIALPEGTYVVKVETSYHRSATKVQIR